MKWLLAGLSFALLVVLAVATVAQRASNVRMRAELHRIDDWVYASSMERGRRRHAMHDVRTVTELSDRWRACMRLRVRQ